MLIYLDYYVQGKDQSNGGGLTRSEPLVAECVGVHNVRESCDEREEIGGQRDKGSRKGKGTGDGGEIERKSEIKREGRERRMKDTGGSNRECYKKKNEKQARQLN